MFVQASLCQSLVGRGPRCEDLGMDCFASFSPGAWRAVILWAICLLGAAACVQQHPDELIVYTALDEDFSREILDRFTRETGISVRAKYDAESTKTVGLTQAILAERRRPRCDVFWNNEVVNTLRLDQARLLAPYDSPVGTEYPRQYRSPDHHWYGFAARARVLIVNTDLLDASDWPQTILALADRRYQGKAAIAKPLAGTTATHAACLAATWGEERMQQYFRDVKANAQVLGGNKQVARAVAAGELAFGLTDTDDAIIEIEAGRPVTIIYPDQGPDEMGVLLIPNTVAIIAGAPHAERAQQLVDFLLSPEVETLLSAGPSAQIPLHSEATPSDRIARPEALKTMEVDFLEAAKRWEATALFLRDLFAAAD